MNSFNRDVAQLINVMVGVFQKKKKSKFLTERIQRGRARASANEFEEELSRLFEKHTPADIQVLVDFPLSFEKPSLKRVKTIYPDIAFIRDNSLMGIVEAKIDLGYLSPDWARDRNQLAHDLISAGIVRVKKREISVSKRLMTACVILTAKNHKERLPSFRKEVDNAFVLISKKHLHPNDDKIVENYLEEITLDKSHQQEWKKFERFIRRLGQNK